MTPEQKAAVINAQAVCALAEIAGMQALNAERAAQGHSLAYGEEAFAAVPDKYCLAHNSVVGFFHDQ